MPRKLHADEMADDHGAELAAEMGCVSADHLIWTSEKGMKAMAKEGVVATLMPGTVLSLGRTKFADARAFIEHGVPVALATDYNPGTCMCPNMLLIMALGCLHMKMTAEEVMVAATINGAAAWVAADTDRFPARGQGRGPARPRHRHLQGDPLSLRGELRPVRRGRGRRHQGPQGLQEEVLSGVLARHPGQTCSCWRLSPGESRQRRRTWQTYCVRRCTTSM